VAPAPAPAGGASATGDVGATGDNVRLIEERLEALHYPVGTVDSTYDADTAQAVMAFQKVHGMERTGRVTPDVWSAMSTAQNPPPLVSGGAERRVEIDIARQVLFLYEGGQLSRIVAVSSGNEVRYCENGSCGNAVTPRGDFKVYRQGRGWEYGPLGGLYNPAYFVGGVAIHGSKSVPPQPASHGCVRVPMSVAEWLPERIPIGTPVHVR
jgi:lipoprotein-anchoring transpeptidase ErfK/SrfK